MDANTLSEKIDKLAKQKADAHVSRMRDCLKKAMEESARGGRAGDGTWFGKTFFAVAKLWISDAEARKDYPTKHVSEEIESYYRGQILDEILTKLPLIKELNALTEGE